MSTDAHRDELEALQAFLIKPDELAVLDTTDVASLPPTLVAAAKAASVAIDASTTALRFRVAPADDDDDTPSFYMWLHVLWPVAYPATAQPVVDLDSEHNTDYCGQSQRRALVARMRDEVKDSGDSPMTLMMLTALRDGLAEIPKADRVKKSLFDTISSTKAPDATAIASGTAAASGTATAGSGKAEGKSASASSSSSSSSSGSSSAAAAAKEVKQDLSKKQKRNALKHLDEKGEKKRGWNWVDLVSHLSKGPAKDV